MKPTTTQAAAFGGLLVALGVCLQTCTDAPPPVVIEEVAAPIEAAAKALDTDDTDKPAAVVTP